MSPANLSARERFSKYLSDHNLRKTPERFALLEKAMSLTGHFGVELLYDEMEKSGYHVSKATIYSTLELLVDCGLLNMHLFDSRKTTFEVALGVHIHLVCTICGKICEVENDSFGNELLTKDLNGFHPTYFSTMVYGICGNCANKNQS